MLSIDTREHGTGGRESAVDVDEECLVIAQLDALADEAEELSDGQVSGHQILALVNLWEWVARAGGCLGALHYHRDLVWVRLHYLAILVEAILKTVLLLEDWFLHSLSGVAVTSARTSFLCPL